MKFFFFPSAVMKVQAVRLGIFDRRCIGDDGLQVLFAFFDSYFVWTEELVFGEDFYKQLTAEEIFEEKLKNGRKKITIENRKQRRNEVFDIAKYNLAAMQFAINRYFEIENNHRKKNHKKEIQVDPHLFFDILENSLYE